MFTIFKNNRPAGNKKYTNYEQARQAVRKLIRKKHAGWTIFTMGNNPAYTTFGYCIRKV